MARWGGRVMLGAVVAVAMVVLAGCEEKKLRAANQELDTANKDLRVKLDTATQERDRLNDEKANLLAQLAAKDRRIQELETTTARQVATVPPAPPVPPTSPAGRAGPSDEFPAGVEVTRGGGVVTVTVPGDVLFAPGKDALNQPALTTLDKVASVLKSRYAGHKIRVVGHTDGDPIKRSGWKDNWDLSMARARAVGNQLIRDGVPREMVEMTGVADTEPRVKPERSASDKQKNRRVTIQVVAAR